jgi:uncharacterized protein (TIGR02246 family)
VKSLAFFCCVVVATALGTACGRSAVPTQPAAAVDHRAEDAASIRSLDAQWEKAMQAKDATQIVSYYAEDARAIWPGSPMADGKPAVAKLWAESLAAPGFAISFSPTIMEVSRSGDLAYQIGDYETTVNDKRGKPQTTKAKFVLIWGKQAGGSWKVVTDISTTTP